MTEEDPKFKLTELIKENQAQLGKHVKITLTEKHLARPPFRFIHDILMSVITTTGFLEGLFEQEELDAINLKTKETKTAFMQKFVDAIKMTTGENIDVKVSKILSGQEAEKTNELLLLLAKALDSGTNSEDVVEKITGKPVVKSAKSITSAVNIVEEQELKPPEVKMSPKKELTKEESPPKAIKKSPSQQSLKGQEHPPAAQQQQLKRKKTDLSPYESKTNKPAGKPSSQGAVKSKIHAENRSKERPVVKEQHKPKFSTNEPAKRTSSNPVVSKAPPPSKPAQNVNPAVKRKTNTKEAEKIYKGATSKQPAVGTNKNIQNKTHSQPPNKEISNSGNAAAKENNKTVPLPVTKNVKKSESSPAVVGKEEVRQSSSGGEKRNIENGSRLKNSGGSRERRGSMGKVEIDSGKGQSRRGSIVEENIQEAPDLASEADKNFQRKNSFDALEPNLSKIIENPEKVEEPAQKVNNKREPSGAVAKQRNSNSKAQTSTINKPVISSDLKRPPSARPGAPRPKTGMIQQESETTIFRPQTGRVTNVLLDNVADDDEDEEENVKIIPPIVINPKDEVIGKELTSSAGILPSDVNLSNVNAEGGGLLVSQIIETKKELENINEEDRFNKAKKEFEKEFVDLNSNAEIEKLKTFIQSMARYSNPLGKLIDFVQEDVEAIQRELNNWREESRKLDNALEAEQMETDRLLEPMRKQLKEIEDAIKNKEDAIAATKMTILRQEEQIQRFLEGLDQIRVKDEGSAAELYSSY